MKNSKQNKNCCISWFIELNSLEWLRSTKTVIPPLSKILYLHIHLRNTAMSHVAKCGLLCISWFVELNSLEWSRSTKTVIPTLSILDIISSDTLKKHNYESRCKMRQIVVCVSFSFCRLFKIECTL